MTVISTDLEDNAITVKTKRIFIAFTVNGEEEVIFVQYREIQYTGTFEGEDYVEITNDPDKVYKSDYATWIASPSGAAIQAAIQASLAKSDPNS